MSASWVKKLFGDKELYFDDDEEELYFDPGTMKLEKRRPTSVNATWRSMNDPKHGNSSERVYPSSVAGAFAQGHTCGGFEEAEIRHRGVAVSDKRIISVGKMTGPGFFGGSRTGALNEACKSGYTSKEFVEKVKQGLPGSFGHARLRAFYKTQSLQKLGESNDRGSVPIWIARDQNRSSETQSVAPAWIEHLLQAINDINYAAPGLHLYVTLEESDAKIRISGTNERHCSTEGDMFCGICPSIQLRNEWEEMKRTSCHELLHALGLGHEHQRRDRDYSVDVREVHVTDDLKDQYCKNKNLTEITPFDPFSILLYREDEVMQRNLGDPVWFTKPYADINREMSELDKVALNNLFRPCKRPHYSPTQSRSVTGLWYCGRYFGVQYDGHDGRCGPTNGPNCPACRVLKTDRVVSLWKKNKWQGWTGGVYCGRYFGVQFKGHDGYCGPNNGPPCSQCYDELLCHY